MSDSDYVIIFISFLNTESICVVVFNSLKIVIMYDEIFCDSIINNCLLWFVRIDVLSRATEE